MNIHPNALPLTVLGSHARQGDTLLRRIDSIPSSTSRQIKSPTLALGEKTGHHHTFTDGGAVAFADDEQAIVADAIRVISPQGSTLTHQEHSPITFPPGDYESLRQVEYTPEELRLVAD